MHGREGANFVPDFPERLGAFQAVSVRRSGQARSPRRATPGLPFMDPPAGPCQGPSRVAGGVLARARLAPGPRSSASPGGSPRGSGRPGAPRKPCSGPRRPGPPTNRTGAGAALGPGAPAPVERLAGWGGGPAPSAGLPSDAPGDPLRYPRRSARPGPSGPAAPARAGPGAWRAPAAGPAGSRARPGRSIRDRAPRAARTRPLRGP